MQTIVVAWREETALVPTGRMTRFDGVNYRPEYRTDWEGKAAMWLRKGTEADIQKAKAHAAKEGWTVYTFPTSERQPLEKAKQAILASHH